MCRGRTILARNNNYNIIIIIIFTESQTKCQYLGAHELRLNRSGTQFDTIQSGVLKHLIINEMILKNLFAECISGNNIIIKKKIYIC